MSKEIEKYNLEYANKLLKNIEEMSDIRFLKVMRPDSIKMEMCSLLEWKKWLETRIATRGVYGCEKEFINILFTIDNQLIILSERSKEGFRRLIDNLEILEQQNKELLEDNKELKEKINEMKDTQLDLLFQLHDLKKETPLENLNDSPVENVEIVEPVNKKKKQHEEAFKKLLSDINSKESIKNGRNDV